MTDHEHLKIDSKPVHMSGPFVCQSQNQWTDWTGDLNMYHWGDSMVTLKAIGELDGYIKRHRAGFITGNNVISRGDQWKRVNRYVQRQMLYWVRRKMDKGTTV